MSNLIHFAALDEEGNETTSRTIPQAVIVACPAFILVAEHYDATGRCGCFDQSNTTMLDWGYTWDESVGQWT